MSRTTTQSQPELFPHDAADSTDEAVVADGYILDFITGEKNLRLYRCGDDQSAFWFGDPDY